MARAIGGVVPAGTWTRRTWLVDRGFQLKIAILMAVAAAVVAAVVGALLQQSHLRAIAGAGLEDAERRAAEASFRVLLVAFAGAATAVAIGVGMLGILISHRVAGPAYVMRRYLSSLALGRYPRVRALRKGDELTDLFVSVAGAIERLRQRDVGQVEQLEEALAAMKGAVDRAPELQEAIATLEAEVAQRRAVLEAVAPAATPAPPPAEG